MNDMSAPLAGLRWEYAVGRIDLVALERKVEDVLAREARPPVVEGLVSVSKVRCWRAWRISCPSLRTSWSASAASSAGG
jgi:hypothetical protein